MPTEPVPIASPIRERTATPTARVHARTTCRSCGTGDLLPVLSLGDQYVSNFFTGEQEGLRAPLELVLCDPAASGLAPRSPTRPAKLQRSGEGEAGCGLLQLRHSVDQGSLYRNYWYRSGVNVSMREALADVAASAERMVALTAGDLVLDIGSNDGTLLRAYDVAGLRLVGFEPATNLMPYAQERGTVTVNDFFGFQTFHRLFGQARAKVITSIAMFYDLEDPNAFVADVIRVLHPNGVWIIQMSYLPLMLSQNAFDNICHEHLEYYALGSLRVLLERHGLKIVDVELNDVNGGSLRAYVVHQNGAILVSAGAPERMQQLDTSERDLQLYNQGTYNAFARRVENIRQEVKDFVQTETTAGKVVDVYGASTKGNTLLQYFGLDHSVIRQGAERNPGKWGKQTVGTGIPIVSEEVSRADPPDYFLVLPWHFLQEFLRREQAFLASGGKFIVPLPAFQVLGHPAGSSKAGGTTPT